MCQVASVVSNSLQPHGLQPASVCGVLCPWDSPGRNTGVGCHFLLQGIFPAQGSSPRLMYPTHWHAFFATVPPGKPLQMCSDSISWCIRMLRRQEKLPLGYKELKRRLPPLPKSLKKKGGIIILCFLGSTYAF